jgi:hypothetical protein
VFELPFPPGTKVTEEMEQYIVGPNGERIPVREDDSPLPPPPPKPSQRTGLIVVGLVLGVLLTTLVVLRVRGRQRPVSPP